MPVHEGLRPTHTRASRDDGGDVVSDMVTPGMALSRRKATSYGNGGPRSSSVAGMIRMAVMRQRLPRATTSRSGMPMAESAPIPKARRVQGRQSRSVGTSSRKVSIPTLLRSCQKKLPLSGILGHPRGSLEFRLRLPCPAELQQHVRSGRGEEVVIV